MTISQSASNANISYTNINGRRSIHSDNVQTENYDNFVEGIEKCKKTVQGKAKGRVLYKNKNKEARKLQLDAALAALQADELEAQLNKFQAEAPKAEVRWLQDLALYLNAKLEGHIDPLLEMHLDNNMLQVQKDYPCSLLPASYEKVLLTFLSSVRETNFEYFYHRLLDDMVCGMSKQQNVLGYKLLLQIIGRNWPLICSNNLASTVMLRNTHDEDEDIVNSLLWAVGQCGYTELEQGIKIWQSLMLPVHTHGKCQAYVQHYIKDVIVYSRNQTLSINPDVFQKLFTFLKATQKTTCSPDSWNCVYKLVENYILSNMQDCKQVFRILMRQIWASDKISHEPEIYGCIELLNLKSICFQEWSSMYKRNLIASSQLLQAMLPQEVEAFKTAAGQEFLKIAEAVNTELIKKKYKNTEILDVLVENITKAKKLSAQGKQQNAGKSGGFGFGKFVIVSSILIALLASALSYDTHVNGKGVFADSAFGQVLQNAGALPYVEKAWYATMSTSARGYKWAEKNVPPVAKPALQASCDVYKLLRNLTVKLFGVASDFAAAKLPVVAGFVEQYIPGLPEKIANFSAATRALCVDLYGKTVEFFTKSVLVTEHCCHPTYPEPIEKSNAEDESVDAEEKNVSEEKTDEHEIEEEEFDDDKERVSHEENSIEDTEEYAKAHAYRVGDGYGRVTEENRGDIEEVDETEFTDDNDKEEDEFNEGENELNEEENESNEEENELNEEENELNEAENELNEEENELNEEENELDEEENESYEAENELNEEDNELNEEENALNEEDNELNEEDKEFSEEYISQGNDIKDETEMYENEEEEFNMSEDQEEVEEEEDQENAQNHDEDGERLEDEVVDEERTEENLEESIEQKNLADNEAEEETEEPEEPEEQDKSIENEFADRKSAYYNKYQYNEQHNYETNEDNLKYKASVEEAEAA